MQRRLAAVMVADVVGYGRLSQLDEEGTRARFQADLKEIFEPRIAAHHGRLIKTMGDGLLVEFSSVVDALRCAVESQQEKAKRDEGAPADKRLHFRIGVNLGDVIVEGDDIHGDGVNIADRMQALAEPGGVAISGTAYDQVKAKLPVGYVSLGEQKVKSIAEPVRVYRLLMDPEHAGKTLGRKRDLRSLAIPAAAAVIFILAAGLLAAWWHPWRTTLDSRGANTVADIRPSLVVLPFDNLSDDKEQGYLADGITEDLTTELARIPGLFVISRNAAFTYKDKERQPGAIAAALGVRYLLEGSVRRAGDDMRINAQLIDATTAGHLWAERFDGTSTDILTLQDKVIQEVAAALELRLVSERDVGGTPGGTTIPAAYDAYLQGLEFENRDTPEDWAKAGTYYQQAVTLDPQFGRALAKLAWVYWTDLSNAGTDTSRADLLSKVNEFLERAKKYPSATYYQVLADRFLWQQKSDEAIGAAERAITLDPSDAYAYEEMSFALTINGRPADALAQLDIARQVDPNLSSRREFLAALAYFCLDRFREAVAALEKTNPNSADVWKQEAGLFLLTSAEAHVGDTAGTESSKKRLTAWLDKLEPTLLLARTDFFFRQPADRERLLNGLRKAGLPELPSGYDSASMDRLTGDQIKALVFGHEFRGRLVETDQPYTRITAADGTATILIGETSTQATTQIEGDVVCTFHAIRGRGCAAIFRNRLGTPAGRNEYLWVVPYYHFEFSIVQ